jgi:cobalt-precorrin 5A hydrolase/precorrin-3B C17-methyltransferase
VHPGLSALQLAAARVGAPLTHDFCAISLSDRLTPWDVIETVAGRSGGRFRGGVLQPPLQGSDWQLKRACDLLLQSRSGATPVVVARQLGPGRGKYGAPSPGRSAR